jgi:hypothetical protein
MSFLQMNFQNIPIASYAPGRSFKETVGSVTSGGLIFVYALILGLEFTEGKHEVLSNSEKQVHS